VKSTFLSLLLAGVVIAAPAVASPERAREYLDQGIAALTRGDTANAVIHFRNALQQDPDSAEAHFRLGTGLFRTGDAAAAEKELRLAGERGFDEDQVALALAELFTKQERFGDLLDEIPAGDRPPATEARIRAARGWALLGLQRTREAERSFKEAIARDPEAAGASSRVGLAQARFIRGDSDEAVALLEKALAEDPKLADGWLFLGRIRETKGDRAGARAALDKAYELAPRSEPVLRARALLALRENEDAAAPEIDALLKQRPNHPFGNYLSAVVKVRTKDWSGAERALAAIQKLEDMPPALLLSGRVQLALGRLARAEDEVGRYLLKHPQDAGANALYAEILLKRGNPAKAIGALETAVAAHPDDVDLAGTLAEALLRNGERDRAASVLDQIGSKAAVAPETRIQLAALSTRAGNLKTALSEIETARSLAPLPARGHAIAIASYLGAGRMAEAAAAAEAFRQSEPRSPLPENVLGYIAGRMEGPEAARKHFRRALELDPTFAPAAINIAQSYRAAGDLAEARAELDRFLGREPDSLPVLVARAQLEQGEERIAWLDRALKVPTKALEPRLQLVRLLIGAGAGKQALALAQELAQNAPNEWRAAAALADAQLAEGDATSAVATYKRVIDMTSGAPMALMAYAGALEVAGDKENARLILERALSTMPTDKRLQTQYVRFCARNGTVAEGLNFARDIATGRNDPQSAAFVAELAEAGGSFADAQFAWQQAVENGGGPEFVQRLALSQAKAGDLAGARSTMSKHVAAHPDDREGRFLLATFAMDLGDTATAVAEHERLLADEPTNPVLLNNLAWLYDKTSDKRALAMAEKAYAIAPKSPLVADTLGWILVRNGDVGRALPLLERGASVAGAGAAKYHFAVALDQAGRADDARAQLRAAVAQGGFPEKGAAEQLLKRLAP
jgi:putative PEP-CTERM system TPR-repeat lipoprotein